METDTDARVSRKELLVLPTRWGNQLNGNREILLKTKPFNSTPHSLGKPIEWKQGAGKGKDKAYVPPHSLGKPIEWKLLGVYLGLLFCTWPPHSLGKPIEWKLRRFMKTMSPSILGAPHSLGKPIEWKHAFIARPVLLWSLKASPLAGETN